MLLPRLYDSEQDIYGDRFTVDNSQVDGKGSSSLFMNKTPTVTVLRQIIHKSTVTILRQIIHTTVTVSRQIIHKLTGKVHQYLVRDEHNGPSSTSTCLL